MYGRAMILLATAAVPTVAQFPTPDRRQQQVADSYRQSIDSCERQHQGKLAQIADPTRYHIPRARELADDEYQRCQQRADRQFRYGGQLRNTTP